MAVPVGNSHSGLLRVKLYLSLMLGRRYWLFFIVNYFPPLPHKLRNNWKCSFPLTRDFRPVLSTDDYHITTIEGSPLKRNHWSIVKTIFESIYLIKLPIVAAPALTPCLFVLIQKNHLIQVCPAGIFFLFLLHFVRVMQTVFKETYR